MSGLSRDDIDEILRLVDQSSFDELRLEVGDTTIEVRRRSSGGDPPAASPASARAGRPAARPSSPPNAASPGRPTSRPDRPAASAADGVVDVPAPQLGIFYHAPRPGEPAFVSVGDEVTPDTTIGIIEVMKLMNTVAAGVVGTVVEIVAPNGESVKQGDTLIRVRVDGGA